MVPHPPMFFDIYGIGIELIYTLIILFFCVIIYYKTKDIYSLTKHKGIQYFRNTFLFFGLAYLFRFMFHSFLLTDARILIPRFMVMAILLVVVGYLSTMAILSLTYSIVWRKVKSKYFLLTSNSIAIIISLLAFISRSQGILVLSQLILLIFAMIVGYNLHKKTKKLSQIFILYVLLFLFWIFNIYMLGPRMFPPFEIKLLFQVVSISIFILIYYKIAKWVK